MTTHTDSDGSRVNRIRQAAEAIRREQAKRARSRLPEIAQKVKQAVLRTFVAERARYERLLAALETTGIPLAALSVCGRGTREIRYTQLLAYFLSPNEPHGLGTAPLKHMFDAEIASLGRPGLDPMWDLAEVNPEFSLGPLNINGRIKYSTIDIFIRTPTLVVLVEHKITSAEESASSGSESTQLRRYSHAYATNFGDLQDRPVLKIFLTPDGRAPKDDQSWRSMRHASIIARFAILLHSDQLSDIARHNVGCLLWDLLGGPMACDGSRREDLVRHLRAALEDPTRYLTLRSWTADHIPSFDIMVSLLDPNHG